MKKKQKKFDEAISVIKAAVVIIRENMKKEKSAMNKFMIASLVAGMEKAIECLEEAQA